MKIIYFSSLKTLLESNCYNLNKSCLINIFLIPVNFEPLNRYWPVVVLERKLKMWKVYNDCHNRLILIRVTHSKRFWIFHYHISHLGEKVEQTRHFFSTWECCLPNLVEISSVVLENFPLERYMILYFNKLESPLSKDAWFQVGLKLAWHPSPPFSKAFQIPV